MRYAWKKIHEKLNQIQTNIYRGTTTQISIINKNTRYVLCRTDVILYGRGYVDIKNRLSNPSGQAAYKQIFVLKKTYSALGAGNVKPS